jgi:hypothetical protein
VLERASAHSQRIARCETAEQQLAAVYDWFRSSVQRADPADRAAVLNRVSQFLAAEADQLDQRRIKQQFWGCGRAGRQEVLLRASDPFVQADMSRPPLA